MLNGSVKLFMSNKILNKYIGDVSRQGFEIYTFDYSKWKLKNHHHDLAAVLDLPCYYGENLDAFKECLSDMVEEETEFVLVFKNYELFAKQNFEVAFKLLNIIQINSWRFLIEDVKLLSFVQTNDATMSFPNLDVMSAEWNGEE
ncbi:barstar family protein [Domibacillus sp. PGB-M46]|uniref:barstar family protein n=1 Tax=Domibacillus sp. PGB-M46 TaxID=2910255 RepID=UPI001F56437B|nr:barstar family protein [Domibacillus sp. PGB-M46]MCI2256895.1 barstar family protein [Domibacillus sp. PGB-M46]